MLSSRQHLFAYGAGTTDRVQEAWERLFAAREALSRNDAELAAVTRNVIVLQAQQDGELEANHRQLLDLQGQLAQARLARTLADEIRAPRAGVVTQVPVTTSALVAAGQRIVTLETGGNRLQALFIVAGELGKRVTPRMEVQIAVSTAPREEFGNLLGRVVSVSP